MAQKRYSVTCRECGDIVADTDDGKVRDRIEYDSERDQS